MFWNCNIDPCFSFLVLFKFYCPFFFWWDLVGWEHQWPITTTKSVIFYILSHKMRRKSCFLRPENAERFSSDWSPVSVRCDRTESATLIAIFDRAVSFLSFRLFVFYSLFYFETYWDRRFFIGLSLCVFPAFCFYCRNIWDWKTTFTI